jgi:hippurate hydrolase
VAALQTVVSRRLNPAHPGVVTVGQIRAGTAPNIIPEDAHLSGTMRATAPDTAALLRKSVEEITHKIADAYYLDAEVEFPEGTPAIVNPPEAADWARQAVTNVLGENAVTPLGFYNLGGEDFAYYMQQVPGCFMRIGAREPGGEVLPAHSPYFYAAGSCIFVGAAVLAECARVASAALAKSS